MSIFLCGLLLCAVQVFGVPVERRVFAMGTWLQVEAEDAGQAERVLQAVEAAESTLSRWRPGSEVFRLNAGESFSVSPLFQHALTRAAHWEQWSDGAFAIRRGGALDSGGLDSGALDFDALAKGAALDHAADSLSATASFALNFGGQVLVRNQEWKGVLSDPLDRERPRTPLVLKHGSLSTSGNAVRPGHIRDARSGEAVGIRGHVTVWAPNALDADCVSTACFALGPERALAKVDATPNLECRFEWLDEHGTFHCRISRNWNQRTQP